MVLTDSSSASDTIAEITYHQSNHFGSTVSLKVALVVALLKSEDEGVEFWKTDFWM